jgi:ribonuclease Z
VSPPFSSCVRSAAEGALTLRRLQLDTSWGALTVAGGSRAGEGTLVLLPQLRLALDAGRPHRALPPMSTVCLSHGHLDHLGALGYWLSQRFLNSMGAATVVVPRGIAADVELLVELLGRLEGGRPYEVDMVAVAPGSRHPLRADMDLEFFRTDHWVETLGVELHWRRRRLKPELAGLQREEIVRRRQRGEEVALEERVPLLAYAADTGPGVFAARPDLLQAEVVLLECSFFAPSDRARAERFGHLHLDDLLAFSDRLRCRHLVLLHGSRRERLRDIEATLTLRLQPRLPCALHHLMVDWE